MKFRPTCVSLLIGLLSAAVYAQTTGAQTAGDVLGQHDLSPRSGSTMTMRGSLGCNFCHAPHSGVGGNTPLWNQQLSKQTYTPYRSSSSPERGNSQPPLGQSSSLCLSCHDGTVAVGQTQAYGKVPIQGQMSAPDVLGQNLSNSHPFSLVMPMKDSPELAASLVQSHKTADTTGGVKLINGNVECTSCHDPHVQAKDKTAQNFLVRDGSAGQLCLACHDPNRVVQGQVNHLTGWATSIHATATNQPTGEAGVGPYKSVAQNACIACHQPHNANGAARLLRAATPAMPGIDPNSQPCITCHNGTSNLSPAAPNVYAEMTKVGHPLPAGSNLHDAAEPGVLNSNRHASCVDCHNPHAAERTANFGAPPVLRSSQRGAVGVSALDGVTVLTPALNQYETCLRCHGSSIGKRTPQVFGYTPMRAVSFAGDPLNLVPQFSATAMSSHPVFHDRSSRLPQPSLLTYMTNLNGTRSGRLVGQRLFCTDCHNSDDNREFGGQGANGPHGSVNAHILERRYVYTQAMVPGGQVTQTYPMPDLSSNGPYAMCAKCHDLGKVVANTSFRYHSTHVMQEGFSCSVCHTAHGVGALSSTISGERLVNFDVKVAAPNRGLPISYRQASGTCTLTCHGAMHNPDGSVTSATSPSTALGRGVRK